MSYSNNPRKNVNTANMYVKLKLKIELMEMEFMIMLLIRESMTESRTELLFGLTLYDRNEIVTLKNGHLAKISV